MSDSARVIQRRRRAWPPAPRTLAAVIATAGLCLLMAACGGSSGESRGAAQLENHCLPGTDLTGARLLPLHAGPQRVEIPRPKHQQQRSGHAGAAQGQPAGTRGQQLTGRRGRKSLPARAPQWCSGEPRRVATNPEQTGGFRTLVRFPWGVELARPSPTLASFPGSPPFGFDLQGIPSLEAGASGSFGPQIDTAIGQCLHLQHLASVQVPWGSWQR